MLKNLRITPIIDKIKKCRSISFMDLLTKLSFSTRDKIYSKIHNSQLLNFIVVFKAFFFLLATLQVYDSRFFCGRIVVA